VSLISSLAQILVDPFYCTINGIQQLIQKEWLAYVCSSRRGFALASEI